MFAINILESAWLLYFAGLYLFHGEEYIYWPAVCLNWCLVEHSPVKTQRHLLVCLFLTRRLSNKTPPTPTPTLSPPLQKKKKVPVVVLARMFTMSSFSFCVRKIHNSSPTPPPTPPFRSLCKVYITMVLFYTILCNLPL